MPDNIDFDFTKVKIKQEKPSPPREKDTEEIINEIIPTLFNEKCTKDNDNKIDDKKNIEPIKSSNEILEELFKVFNAAPPKSLLNDEFLVVKREKKKHKKDKKHKKKLRKKGRSSSDNTSDNDYVTSKGDKTKKRKKKKSKRSENRSKKQKVVDKDEKSKDKVYSPKIPISNKINFEDSEFSISDYDENNLPKSPISKIRIKIEKEDDYNNTNYRKGKNGKEKEYITFSTELPNKTSESISRCKNKNEKNDQNLKSKSFNIEKRSDPNNTKKEIDSEISLSDEETYLKEKYSDLYYQRSRSNESDRKKNELKRQKNRIRDDNEFYKGSREITRDRDRRSYRSSSRNRYNRSRWNRSRSRSLRRSTSRSRELGIDKKRLLEIARKNAISMFKKGALPGTQQMSQDIKDKVLMKMRYGGKTVEDLTDFCKKLSNGENLNELSELSSNAESDHDKDGNDKAFVHHPFVIKDRAPIVMNIKNSVPIQPKTAEETKALLMQFPVSSGQQHRLNESEWVPVSPSKTENAKSATSGNIIPTVAKRFIQHQLSSQIPKTVFGKALPSDQKQMPAFVSLISSSNTTTNVESESTNEMKSLSIDTSFKEPAMLTTTKAPPPSIVPQLTMPSLQSNMAISSNLLPSIPAPLTVPPPKTQNIAAVPSPSPQPPLIRTKDSIFPQHEQANNLDVATIITKRLNAMRRLQENPMDAEALKIMYTAQKDMSAWVSMKQVPGQFTGSTGVNVLSAKELSGGVHAWAKRDQLTNTAPVCSGMGMHLLQKMGWKPGEGLGRERNGALQPLLLEVKLDKRGVMANEEDPHKRRSPQGAKKIKKIGNNVQQVKEDLENKHPVSLLGEIATKRRWIPPIYELVDDKGPSHNKAFIFKVVVNNIVYQPSISSTTKKSAKAVAAKYCLQQLGVLAT